MAFWMPAGEFSINVGWVKSGTLESEHALAAAITRVVASGATLRRQPLADAALLMQCGVCAVMLEAQVEGEEETARGRILEDVLRCRHVLIAERARFRVETSVGERHPQIAPGE